MYCWWLQTMYPTIDVCNSNCMTFEHVFIECLYAGERLQLNEMKTFKCPCICVNSTLRYMSNSYICTPTHQRISSWKGQLLQVPQGAYQWWPLLVCSHRQGGQSSPETVLLLEETEEVWHGVSHPHKLLQMHDKEHLSGCISVVRELQIYYLGTSFSSDLAHLTFVSALNAPPSSALHKSTARWHSHSITYLPCSPWNVYFQNYAYFLKSSSTSYAGSFFHGTLTFCCLIC